MAVSSSVVMINVNKLSPEPCYVIDMCHLAVYLKQLYKDSLIDVRACGKGKLVRPMTSSCLQTMYFCYHCIAVCCCKTARGQVISSLSHWFSRDIILAPTSLTEFRSKCMCMCYSELSGLQTLSLFLNKMSFEHTVWQQKLSRPQYILTGTGHYPPNIAYSA